MLCCLSQTGSRYSAPCRQDETIPSQQRGAQEEDAHLFISERVTAGGAMTTYLVGS